MPKVKLTKPVVDGLAPGAKDAVYWDAALPGFGIKVTPTGRKVFIALYRTRGGNSRLRKYTIGPYGRLTLHQARDAAQRVFAARLDGRDPASEKLEARRREVVDRIDDLVRAYTEQHLSKLRGGRDVRLRLEREIVLRWRARSIHDIKRRDIGELITEVALQRTPYSATKLLKSIKHFFTWCMGRGLLESSPAFGVVGPWRAKTRDRVLDDDELARVIRAARVMGGAFGNVVEFLALTGQRREEVNRMTWDEVDLDARVWVLPAVRAKNGRKHIIQLSREAVAVIERQPRIGPYVFSPTQRPFHRFGHHKPRLDELCGVHGWVIHDLRRTCVSGMARLGVAPHIADKILNHQSGTISGVAAVYQRHDFLAERREALERWGEHVSKLIEHDQPIRPRLALVCESGSLRKADIKHAKPQISF